MLPAAAAFIILFLYGYYGAGTVNILVLPLRDDSLSALKNDGTVIEYL